ncbi:hypothetical protein [Rhizobium sp. BK602]|uniref:hypothetical protein n=1 Tax=Rhizobium sp. BK602 TaxID=2586986 RepID=UPI001622B74A|nr:hypothetical protein [Rhizobium sp. BK602]MBB3608665.1 hypothetical protein [Rhizobium sp. BK602]
MDWTSALAGMEETCADVFDVTPCRLQPRTNGRSNGRSVNHSEQNDPERAAFDFMGTLELGPPSTKVWRHLSPDPGDAGNRSDTVSYDAVLTAHTGGWPYKPVRGDFFIVGNDTWRIASILPDGTVRPAFLLVRA